jgi:hypothetical protein
MRWVMGRLAKMADVECGGSEAGGGMMEAGEKREEGTAGIKKKQQTVGEHSADGRFVRYVHSDKPNQR